MKSWAPTTLKAQALVIVTAAFLVSHVVSLLLYESDRTETVILTEASDLAARIAGIVDLTQSLPEVDRARILAAAQTQFLSLTDIEPANDACRENAFAERMHAELSSYFSTVPGLDADVCVRSMEELRLLPGPNGGGFDVLVTIRFQDGSQSVFHAALPEAPPLFNDRVIGFIALLGLIFLVIAWYLIIRIITPLDRFTSAADEMGLNIDAPSIAETGTREVVQAARAFNRMQTRIRRLVHGQTEMIAAISHDLRSAITRLRLRAELVGQDDNRRGLMRVIDDMSAMVQAALDYARGASPSEPMRKTDITALVESLCDDLEDEGQPVSLSLLGADISGKCRPSALRRALGNVIANAVKYGGSAHVSLIADADWLVIRVEDNGPGVPEGEVEKIVQPYYRVEQSRNRNTGGIGLGLPIALNIAHAHGGDLHISNRAEGGLRVDIRLPR
ncbi:ATP-binding protein [Gimibacter soli]|uniref:histidine kinase n=1 Tax=Gimibacter soli TaxID=3024400 RepID=A0AAF0BKP3_9PROT|nr:ATP-binding protein [Gimibacter soli]WCL54509.1 ATP-binding protein [Gimibacter soli]